MEKYVEQLIEDIRKATWNEKPPHDLWVESKADPDNELELEDMSYVEKYLYGEKESISSITGIETHFLPPPEKLTKKQKELLSKELEKLLSIHHFELDFPRKYPHHLRYSFIRNFWDEEHVAMSFGTSHIEFCEYEKEKCPFPGYCKTCDEVEAQMKFDEESANRNINDNLGDDELPF